MTNNDYAYFAGRAREEDEAARQASCIEARICHEELAAAYRDRCRDLVQPLTMKTARNPAVYATIKRKPMVPSKTTVLAASPAMAI
jgi:hypothetical protein